MRISRPAAVIAALALALPAAAQQPQQAPVITPNENLVAEGIPPIPASLAAEVRRYTESRGAAFVDWHPVRRELLISTRFANTTQVHRVAMPMGARTQLTFFDEPVGETTYQRVGGRYFLLVKDVGGNEFGQIYRYDVADGRVTLLTDGGRSQNGGIAWSRAGDRIAYASTRRNGADRDIYVMDPLNPRSDHRVAEGQGGGWGVLDWAPDGRRLLLGEYLSVNQSHLWLLDLQTGEKTRITPADTAAWGGAEFTTDGRTLIATTDLGSEFQQLVRMNLLTKGVVPLAPQIKWDVESFDLSPDGRTVAFATNEAGVSKLYLYNMDTGRVRPVTAGMPQGVIGGLRWHNNSRDLGFSASSARSTNDVYSLNAATDVVTRWTESELGGIPAAELSEPRLIRWPSFDGREITGFYYPAPARFTGKRPVIINIHGGPEGQSRPTFLGRSNYFINELGVAIIYPNVRGSTGYGKTFVKLDNGMKRMDSVRDIGALLDWIARQPELDASRVMVTGGSYGGFMTLAVATNYNDRIRASLDVVGISNFNTFLKNTEAYRRDLRRAEYGDERQPEMAAFFDRTAPLNLAGNITRPLFVVQGGNDPRVPHTEAEQMVARVKQNGSPVWYLMARDEGHGFRKKANVDYQFYATVMFIRQYLLGQG